MKFGIIGGTGVDYGIFLAEIKEEVIETPFGVVWAKRGKDDDRIIYFLARHGEGHSIPPHKINYRANIWGLKQVGVLNVLATSAVGSLNLAMKPGDLVIITQFIDFTKGRKSTFFEDSKVVHIDMTEPYCRRLRGYLVEAAEELNIPFHLRGTYVCTEGPRFETCAEILMYQKLGGDVVGMTNVPEVVLAREAGICYAALAVVTNYAAGISERPLSHAEVEEVMGENIGKLTQVFLKAIDLAEDVDCSCRHVVGE